MRIFFTLFFSLLFCRSLFSIDFDAVKAEHFTISNGLPQNYVTDVHQDKNGYIWVSTLDGISRYNGYRFKNFYFDPYHSNSLISNYAIDVQDFNENEILITTFLGLSIYNPEKEVFHNIYLNSGNKKVGNILSSKVTPTGEIFVGTTSGLYQVVITDTLENQLVFKLKNVFQKESKNLCILGSSLFFSSDNQVYEYKNKQLSSVSYDFKKGITSLSVLDNRHLLVGAENWLIYIENINSDRIKSFEYQFNQPDLLINEVEKLNGQFWIATNSGIAILNSKAWVTQHFNIQWINDAQGKESGISNNYVFKILHDSFGMMWIGTKNGLDKIDTDKQRFNSTKRSRQFYDPNLNNDTRSFYENKHYLMVGYADGLSIHSKTNLFSANYKLTYSVNDICEISPNEFILATSLGLKKLRVDNDKCNFKGDIPTDKELDTKEVFKILKIQTSLFLLATINGVVLYSPDKGILSKWNEPYVFDIKSGNNTYWAVSSSGVFQLNIEPKTFALKSNKIILERFQQITPKSVLPDNNILWIAYTGGGLVKYTLSNKKIQHFSTKDGLASNSVLGILKDNNGYLWMNTNGGISKLNLEDLKFTNYTLNDGQQSIEFNQGAYFRNASGKLYFGSIDGYHMVDPSLIVKNYFPPKVHIAGLKINGINWLENKSSASKNDTLIFDLKYNQNSITILVDALHFSSPEENIIEYNLLGIQDEWVRVKNQREFYFPKLNPGNYVFNVRVASADGVWSTEVKTIYINIHSPFWFSWWFIALANVVLVGLVLAVYYSRISLVKQQKKVLERKIKQRTREVEQQKEILEQQKAQLEEDKSKEEKLLFNLLPSNTAKELIQYGKSSPKNYRLASVMFADFKNFTKITENLRPNELVAELDDSFAHFDDIVDKYKVEKIKTSGDAYMCVGGVPGRNRTNPVDCVLAGLSFLKYIDEKKRKREGSGKPQWELRVGIHTGKLVAGVIGKKKFLYDVWGDTVNIASRMESTGDSGRINVSGTTYEYIKDYFICEYRGKLPVKNKGDIEMYYVNRIKPEFSEDEQGFLPNKKFFSVLEFNVYSDISYKKVRAYMLERLQNELPDNLYYHGVHHTVDVINATERIAISEGRDQEEVMLLKLAALFHDSGFLRKYRNNEPNGAELAREILPNYGFTDQQVEIVEKLILATKIPQAPNNLMEQIICDADLDYLGREKEEFEQISGSLRKELFEYGFLKTEADWDPIQVEFLSKHKYFTATAIKERQTNKTLRLEEIKQRIGKA